jgi:hypothetical protein
MSFLTSLILTMLHGLNELFSHTASLVKLQHPFPMFTEIRKDMHLKGIQMVSKPGSSSMALVITTTAAGRNPSTSTHGGSSVQRAPTTSAPSPTNPKKSNKK